MNRQYLKFALQEAGQDYARVRVVIHNQDVSPTVLFSISHAPYPMPS